MLLDQFATIQLIGEFYKTRPGESWESMEIETHITLRPGPTHLLREDGGIPDNAETGAEGVDMEQADRILKEIRDVELIMEEDDEYEDEG